MRAKGSPLHLHAAPFLQHATTTPRVMLDVVYALVPVILASLWWFGLSALLVLLASSAGAVLTEWLFSPPHRRGASLRDGSAILTGLLVGLTLPPGMPLWMASVGGVASIGLGKLVWGGLGNNLFNPALVGRAFLQAAFPSAITTWTPCCGDFFSLPPGTLAFPFMHAGIDAVTSATPLGLMKFQQQATPYSDLLIGNVAGSLGETSGMMILLGGVYLVLRRSIDWRIPAAIVLSAVLVSGVLFLLNATRFPDPAFMILSGSLLFGAIYMATDPVTSPLTPRGTWIFGVGIGVLVVLIRLFGGLPEGVMYAILLMNAATPLIARYSQPRVFGHG